MRDKTISLAILHCRRVCLLLDAVTSKNHVFVTLSVSDSTQSHLMILILKAMAVTKEENVYETNAVKVFFYR